MHLGTKRLAFLGLLLAIAVSCTILGSVIETSTFFFLAAGSYLVGVAYLETNLSYGIAFYLASVFLSLILAPNKLYCLTFAAMSGYLLATELIRKLLVNQHMKKLATLEHEKVSKPLINRFLWLWKIIIFNVIYIPILIFAPKLIFAGQLSSVTMLLLLCGGQLVLIIYDLAYHEFIVRYWKKLRKNML